MFYHLIGIGGIGMSALAQLLKKSGHTVTGSDIEAGDEVIKLKRLGYKIFIGHKRSNLVKDVDIVVRSLAIKSDNPELREAKKRKIKILRHAETLNILFKDKLQIGVAGTHGKTTTTAIVSKILLDANCDPSFFIGGNLPKYGNARLGKGKYFVFEADEFGNRFLDYTPFASIILNLEADHLDFFKTYANYKNAFERFASKPSQKIIVTTKDVPKSVFKNPKTKLITIRKPDLPKKVELLIPGEHNRINAALAMRLCKELGISERNIYATLRSFTGVERRQEVYLDTKNLTLIDDYAHHPTEISVTVEALRQKYPDKKLVLIFQPHQYSRTKLLFKDFVRSLALADEIVLAPIYSVRDTKKMTKSVTIYGLKKQIEKINRNVAVYRGYDQIVRYLIDKSKKESGLLLITMGAAPINMMARKFINRYNSLRKNR